MDLMEVRPAGEDGSTHIMTCVCVATRYVFLRCCRGREHHHLAEILMDVILDAGCIPRVIQSDQEFSSAIISELGVLLGSNQIFSTALRPQPQGITERSHREIRSTLASFVETLVRAHPRRWPTLVRIAESKLRHKTLLEVEGVKVTPYSVVHGFYGSSSLKSAVQAIAEVPVEVVSNAWMSEIIQQSQHLMTLFSQEKEALAVKQQREMAEKQPIKVKVGELVLLRKPFFERGAGLILPQADGPFQIYKLLSQHSCQLAEILSGDLVQNGKLESPR